MKMWWIEKEEMIPKLKKEGIREFWFYELSSSISIVIGLQYFVNSKYQTFLFLNGLGNTRLIG